jgi:hypothetical protein
MSTADGTVIGTTQIAGSLPRNRAFNIVLLAEGFTAAQQNDFDTQCTTFLNALGATPPFDRLAPAINVFRVNVSSTDAGADDPAAAGGTGTTARTYFDATFGANNIRRLLVCNNTTALAVAAAQIPEFTVVLMIVNSTIYGGSGGVVGTYSLAGGATEIAIHEMGHTAFGLADEYAYYARGLRDRPRRASCERADRAKRDHQHRPGDAEMARGRRRGDAATDDVQSELRGFGYAPKSCCGGHDRVVRGRPLLSLQSVPA